MHIISFMGGNDPVLGDPTYVIDSMGNKNPVLGGPPYVISSHERLFCELDFLQI